MSLLQKPDFRLLVVGQPEMNRLAEAVCPWWGYALGSGSELAVLLLTVLLLSCPRPLTFLGCSSNDVC